MNLSNKNIEGEISSILNKELKLVKINDDMISFYPYNNIEPMVGKYIKADNLHQIILDNRTLYISCPSHTEIYNRVSNDITVKDFEALLFIERNKDTIMGTATYFECDPEMIEGLLNNIKNHIAKIECSDCKREEVCPHIFTHSGSIGLMKTMAVIDYTSSSIYNNSSNPNTIEIDKGFSNQCLFGIITKNNSNQTVLRDGTGDIKIIFLYMEEVPIHHLVLVRYYEIENKLLICRDYITVAKRTNSCIGSHPILARITDVAGIVNDITDLNDIPARSSITDLNKDITSKRNTSSYGNNENMDSPHINKIGDKCHISNVDNDISRFMTFGFESEKISGVVKVSNRFLFDKIRPAMECELHNLKSVGREIDYDKELKGVFHVFRADYETDILNIQYNGPELKPLDDIISDTGLYSSFTTTLRKIERNILTIENDYKIYLDKAMNANEFLVGNRFVTKLYIYSLKKIRSGDAIHFVADPSTFIYSRHVLSNKENYIERLESVDDKHTFISLIHYNTNKEFILTGSLEISINKSMTIHDETGSINISNTKEYSDFPVNSQLEYEFKCKRIDSNSVHCVSISELNKKKALFRLLGKRKCFI
eukprot:GHVP01068450.1.p1 GENE.GHVP01068450.1~~GHVP01068450.1.p1  ORF type:complete len:597 (+),score=65.58 GHVP01068450.1:28-1818(+)